MTLLEPCNEGADLRMTCTMPSIEVGTVGGGTNLPAQVILNFLELYNREGCLPGYAGRQRSK